jgi:perosamine synthetase
VNNTNCFYPVAEPNIGTLEEEYVMDAIRSGWVSSLGEYIGKFEEQFAEYCGCAQGISTSNGTTALHLALASLGVGPGDEVIVPTLTFVATANAVMYCGATPVFVDSDPEHWGIDHVAVERAISPRTKAIIVVHLYGHPADMDPLLTLARTHGLYLIEDAAEAHGATYHGQKVGSIGDVGIFSFYGNKLITTGEGGMLVTNDSALAERAKFLRDHAMSKEKRYWHPELGYNYRLTNIQAALGLAQLQRLNNFLAKKRMIISWYQDRLAEHTFLKLNPELPWACSSFWLVCVLLPDHLDQSVTMGELRKHGIDSRPFFHLPFYKDAYRTVGRDTEGCPVAEMLSQRGINLPSGVLLEQDDVNQICDALFQATDVKPDVKVAPI